MIKVFYDAKCGLCSKEINHYKKIAPTGIFEWIDITQSIKIIKQENLDLENTLRLLHVKDDDGKLHIGTDAFILIWYQLKRWRILATIVSLPIIRQTANIVYKIFANWRFKRINYCDINFKNKENK
ncbi:MAG: putative DCC family thiol-disulfide oxidoreductase YuxK [Francisella sp.]|jgi:predicted DCC family thiol-disulfide oxidoreductase YuxK